jgi:hypothetical protein
VVTEPRWYRVPVPDDGGTLLAMNEHSRYAAARESVLAAAALDALVADVGAVEADRFAGSYLELLEKRVALLHRAAVTADVDQLHEAALSLHATSAMVGAQELAGSVAALSEAMAAGAVREVRTALQEIEIAAALTTGALVARRSAVPADAAA